MIKQKSTCHRSANTGGSERFILSGGIIEKMEYVAFLFERKT